MTLLNGDSHTKHRHDAPYFFWLHLKKENQCIIGCISMQTACFILVLQLPTHVLSLIFLGTAHTFDVKTDIYVFLAQGPDLSSQSFTFLTF